MKIFKEDGSNYQEAEVVRFAVQFRQLVDSLPKKASNKEEADLWSNLCYDYLTNLLLLFKPDYLEVFAKFMKIGSSELEDIVYEGKGEVEDFHVRYLRKKFEMRSKRENLQSFSDVVNNSIPLRISREYERKFDKALEFIANKIIEYREKLTETLHNDLTSENLNDIIVEFKKEVKAIAPTFILDNATIESILDTPSPPSFPDFEDLEEEQKLSEYPVLAKIKQDLISEGLEPHIFESAKLIEVYQAINNKKFIEGVDIVTRLKNPKFRFITPDIPVLSLAASESLVSSYQNGILDGSSNLEKVREKGREKSKENADEFAARMFEVVENLKREEKISSFRETVKMLNQKKIPTYRGGNWHIGTFQNLEKRWKNLGFEKNNPI